MYTTCTINHYLLTCHNLANCALYLTIIELEANHSMLLNNFTVGFLAAFAVVSLVLMVVLLAVATCTVIVCWKKIIAYMRRKMSDDTLGLIK